LKKNIKRIKRIDEFWSTFEFEVKFSKKENININY